MRNLILAAALIALPLDAVAAPACKQLTPDEVVATAAKLKKAAKRDEKPQGQKVLGGFKSHGGSDLANLGGGLWVAGARNAALYATALAVEKSPRDPIALNNLGVILLEEKKLEDGCAILRRARRLAPKSPLITANLGVAEHERGNIARAEKLYQEALIGAPLHPQANYGMAAIASARGQWAAARGHLNKSQLGGKILDKRAARALRKIDRLLKKESPPEPYVPSWHRPPPIEAVSRPPLPHIGAYYEVPYRKTANGWRKRVQRAVKQDASAMQQMALEQIPPEARAMMEAQMRSGRGGPMTLPDKPKSSKSAPPSTSPDTITLRRANSMALDQVALWTTDLASQALVLGQQLRESTKKIADETNEKMAPPKEKRAKDRKECSDRIGAGPLLPQCYENADQRYCNKAITICEAGYAKFEKVYVDKYYKKIEALREDMQRGVTFWLPQAGEAPAVSVAHHGMSATGVYYGAYIDAYELTGLFQSVHPGKNVCNLKEATPPDPGEFNFPPIRPEDCPYGQIEVSIEIVSLSMDCEEWSLQFFLGIPKKLGGVGAVFEISNNLGGDISLYMGVGAETPDAGIMGFGGELHGGIYATFGGESGLDSGMKGTLAWNKDVGPAKVTGSKLDLKWALGAAPSATVHTPMKSKTYTP